MPRMRRGKQRTIEQIAQPEGQCMWCGKVLEGEHKGEMLDRLEGGIYTGSFCDDCRPEYYAQQYREMDRRRAFKAGLPEEEWPPSLLSRLEQRTGSRFGVGTSNDEGMSEVGGVHVSGEHRPAAGGEEEPDAK